MKTVFKFKALAFFLCAFFVSSVAFAQMDNGKTIPSPRDSVSGTAAGATIKINYGSPSVRGRVIFGGTSPLEAYGKVWRAGANMMTTFETSKDIMVEGKKLPAGKYSLFATPGETSWNIIFNSVTGQWGIHRDGTANDDPAKDVLVVTVAPMKHALTERLTYTITSTGFALVWENVAVPVKIN
jgi:hypothetical protein